MAVGVACDFGTALSEGGAGAGPALEGALDRAQLGDRAAFAELYEALAGDVERLCARLFGSRPDAEDARNEVFLRAQSSFPRYDRQRPFRRWLLAVAAHHCIDQLRRRRVEGRLFDAASLDEEALADAAPGPLRATLEAEERRRLLAELDALPDAHRVSLALRYFAELSYAEIGEVLGVSPAQVGTLIFRAKARLRGRFAEGGRS